MPTDIQWIIQTLLRVLCAIVAGGLIGLERVRHGRAAGIRTHILVSLGACMTALTSVYLSQYAGMQGDVFRLSAQVISGVGFLGAGMIVLKSNNMITGLTTAAGVWTTATIGIALGYGFYSGAAVVTAAFLLTVILIARLEKRKRAGEVIYIELADPYLLNETVNILKETIPSPFNYQVTAPKSGLVGALGVTLTIDRRIDPDRIDFGAIPSVIFAVEE